MKYRCKHCKKTVERKSRKAWLDSFCDEAGKKTRLYRLTQTRRQSLLEVTLSTACGYLVALATQLVVFPLYGLPVEIHQNMQIALIFTAVSLARSYVFRRVFNRLG